MSAIVPTPTHRGTPRASHGTTIENTREAVARIKAAGSESPRSSGSADPFRNDVAWIAGRFTLSKFKQPDRRSMTWPGLLGKTQHHVVPNIASFMPGF